MSILGASFLFNYPAYLLLGTAGVFRLTVPLGGLGLRFRPRRELNSVSLGLAGAGSVSFKNKRTTFRRFGGKMLCAREPTSDRLSATAGG